MASLFFFGKNSVIQILIILPIIIQVPPVCNAGARYDNTNSQSMNNKIK